MTSRLTLLLCILALPVIARAQESPEGSVRVEVKVINLEAREGMLFHPARAKVKAGSRLIVQLTNLDPNDMPHNVSLVAPGKLAEIQQASLAIDSSAEARGFVPDHPAILGSSKLIGVGESSQFSFDLPADAEDIYYLVCTFPGHAMVMYLPVYVGLNPKLELVDDPEVSPLVRLQEEQKIASLADVARPKVLRTIMDDTGTASILVALPGKMNFCWDATTCRLRYAWSGEFANPMPHFNGNGSKRAEILGSEFWRSLPGEDVSGIGLAHTADRRLPDYLGYDLIDGIPTFRYKVQGIEIHERITEHAGGLRWTFQLADSTSKQDWKILAPGRSTAKITSPGNPGAPGVPGAKRENDHLLFSPPHDRPFEITLHPKKP